MTEYAKVKIYIQASYLTPLLVTDSGFNWFRASAAAPIDHTYKLVDSTVKTIVFNPRKPDPEPDDTMGSIVYALKRFKMRNKPPQEPEVVLVLTFESTIKAAEGEIDYWFYFDWLDEYS